jgi:hypothetical protein
MESQPQLTKESAIRMLVSYVEMAQTKGAFELGLSRVYKLCRDYLDPAIKEKPTLTQDGRNQELFALDQLSRAVNTANTKGSYSLDEAHAVAEVIIFLQQEISKELKDSSSSASSSGSQPSGSSKKRAFGRQRERDESEEERNEESEEEERVRSASLKGKSRAQ